MNATGNEQFIVLQNHTPFQKLQKIKRENGTGSSQQRNNGIDAKDYRREENRLSSFDNWPRTDVEVDKLASAGFYYSGEGEVVRCAFCDIKISNWEPTDIPMADHAKWSKKCPFVNNQHVGNVPLHASVNSLSTDSGTDECGLYKTVKPMPGNLIKGLNINECPNFVKMRAPSFEEFKTEDARLKSFESWPISLKLKPAILSQAGFYYTGKGDQTICFHCGGGLKDWEETDEPWVEHARWFSKCPFVMLLKGKDFIDEVCGKKAIMDLKGTELPNGSGLSSSTGELEKVLTCQPSTETSAPESSRNKTYDESEHACTSYSSSCESPSLVLPCKICYADEKNAVFIPCGHMVACVKCASTLIKCPVCRQTVAGVLKTFNS